MLNIADERTRCHRVDRGRTGGEGPPGRFGALGELPAEIFGNAAPEDFLLRSSKRRQKGELKKPLKASNRSYGSLKNAVSINFK